MLSLVACGLRLDEHSWPSFLMLSFCLCCVCCQSAEDEALINKVRSAKVAKRYELRKKLAKVEPAIDEQFCAGRILGMVPFVDNRSFTWVHCCAMRGSFWFIVRIL